MEKKQIKTQETTKETDILSFSEFLSLFLALNNESMTKLSAIMDQLSETKAGEGVIE